MGDAGFAARCAPGAFIGGICNANELQVGGHLGQLHEAYEI